VIRGIREGLAGDRLTRVQGVLNGTCNYILTRMESARLGFDEALDEAQAAGFAEADPTDDLDGYDARAKLSILARVALGCALPPASITCGSIRPVRDIDFVYAAQLGATIRQVSRAIVDGDGLVAGVHPGLVAHSAPLARAVRNQNIVVVTGETGGDTGFFGFGAGGGPTAVAVMSDVLALTGHRATAASSAPAGRTPSAVRAGMRERQYVRFVVDDRPGIIAAIATACATHGINIDSVLQVPWTDKGALPFVVTLDPCEPEALAPALDAMRALPFNVAPPFAMPFVE
jgi:homoserine dehydrogenase